MWNRLGLHPSMASLFLYPLLIFVTVGAQAVYPAVPEVPFDMSSIKKSKASKTKPSKAEKKRQKGLKEIEKAEKKLESLRNKYGIFPEPPPAPQTTPQAIQAPEFHRSALADKLLTGLRGFEIGGSIHNQFGLNTLNIDYSDSETTAFKQEEVSLQGSTLKVDIIAPGDCLPFKDNTIDYVISSHVIEHFYDPIKTMKEWLRVVKPGGYVYVIAPHKERTFDKDRERTTLAELINRHEHPNPPFPDHHGHYSVWITQDFVELCEHFEWNVVAVQDVDDKVGNGFTVVIQKSYN